MIRRLAVDFVVPVPSIAQSESFTPGKRFERLDGRHSPVRGDFAFGLFEQLLSDLPNRSFEPQMFGSPVDVILKLGGSLLDLADLPARMRRVLSDLGAARVLLVCGGGTTADVVRSWHRDLGLGEEQAHWLALQAVRLNQALLLERMPELQLVSNRASAESVWTRHGVPLLDLMAFVSLEELRCAGDPEDKPLPHTWDVTSDSLAAWVTLRWPAQRLVLLKSVDRPTPAAGDDPDSLGNAVDAFFEQLRPKLPALDWINLRDFGL